MSFDICLTVDNWQLSLEITYNLIFSLFKTIFLFLHLCFPETRLEIFLFADGACLRCMRTFHTISAYFLLSRAGDKSATRVKVVAGAQCAVNATAPNKQTQLECNNAHNVSVHSKRMCNGATHVRSSFLGVRRPTNNNNLRCKQCANNENTFFAHTRSSSSPSTKVLCNKTMEQTFSLQVSLLNGIQFWAALRSSAVALTSRLFIHQSKKTPEQILHIFDKV